MTSRLAHWPLLLGLLLLPTACTDGSMVPEGKNDEFCILPRFECTGPCDGWVHFRIREAAGDVLQSYRRDEVEGFATDRHLGREICHEPVPGEAEYAAEAWLDRNGDEVSPCEADPTGDLCRPDLNDVVDSTEGRVNQEEQDLALEFNLSS